MQSIKQIKAQIKVTPITSDGKTFNTYKILNKVKKYVDLRFTKEAKNIPNVSCIAIINLENLDYTENYKYPRYWCKGIESYTPITFEKDKTSMLDDFDEVVTQEQTTNKKKK